MVGDRLDVMVVGSCNLDLVVDVDHHPGPGETVLGGELAQHPGGKGANQAVAAARLGVRTGMVGCVGEDDAGLLLLDELRSAGVDTLGVRRVAATPSGAAFIAVDRAGENTIVVSPGANSCLESGEVAAAVEERPAAVLLVQLEIPESAVEAAVRSAGGMVVLNPAPARFLPTTVVEQVDVLVPNQHELAALTDRPALHSIHDIVDAALQLPAGSVVVTLGASGSVVVSGGDWLHVPAAEVVPVDTTAAGDAFCGALAASLSRARSLEEAVQYANRAAGVAVSRHGGQPSLPTPTDLPS
ncbi:MAG: Ribokinase [Acidimicrobiales bacterium]|nr:MAG: ribokinase [Actinomycetota bacterium]MBV6509133.1 Ribokinase [Acidimicrobiales bacterium]RIK08516.1 MAG: ribokinase [Acidobacteriota bacterium]